MSIRHTVGGAQNVVARQLAMRSSRPGASKRAKLQTSTVAPAFHGANTLLQACLAQPGEEMLRCTSPGCTPCQYIVDRWPTGYDVWVCSTSLGWAVVPDVKYSSRVSSPRLRPSMAVLPRYSYAWL